MGMGLRHHHGRQCLLRLCIRDMATVSHCAETMAGKRENYIYTFTYSLAFCKSRRIGKSG